MTIQYPLETEPTSLITRIVSYIEKLFQQFETPFKEIKWDWFINVKGIFYFAGTAAAVV